MVNIQTTPVSQTEIEINFDPFGPHNSDIQFNIYRYDNGSTQNQNVVAQNLKLADLPYRDTG